MWWPELALPIAALLYWFRSAFHIVKVFMDDFFNTVRCFPIRLFRSF